MFQATSRSSPASAAIGTQATSGASTSMAPSTTTAWKTAEKGERAPARMFVAVRASAPVAAMPPKKGATRLPMPRPTSSALGSCRLPVMPSAMTAESRDSMAPSMAMAKAEAASCFTVSKSSWAWLQGSSGEGSTGGMPL